MNKQGVAYAIVGMLLLALVAPARAGVVIFTDVDEFRAAAGPLVEIDFTVLPDGTPTPFQELVPITPEFNYTDRGVTFSSPELMLHVFGSTDGATLAAVSKSSIRNWIEAEFDPAAYAVGVTTLATLSVFDAEGAVLGQSPSAGFIGFVSDAPIASALVDDNSNGVNITSILFRPVPEPATLLLLGAGLVVVARRRKAQP